MKVVLESKINAKEWNDLIKSASNSSFFQTTLFVDAYSKICPVTPIFIKVMEGDKSLGLLLALKLPVYPTLFSNVKIGKAIYRLFEKVFSKVVFIQGPVLLTSDNQKNIISLLFSTLINYCEKNKIYELNGTSGFNELSNFTFDLKNLNVKLSATFLIDLTKDKAQLWQNLDKAARKAIQSCETAGVLVSKISNASEYDEYFTLLKDFRSVSGLKLPPFYSSFEFWKTGRGIYTDIYVARLNGKIVSGIGIVYFNGVITEVAVARDLNCKLYAQDAIKWKIIADSSFENFKLYDLGGVSPNPQSQKEKGIYQFKAKWGGKLVNYYEYSQEFTNRRNLTIRRLLSIYKK